MTLTRFFFIFSQLFFLTTCESRKNKSVSDLCQTVYTTYIVFTDDICHIMKHLTHNTHILYFLFHNVSFPLLSYTIFYLNVSLRSQQGYNVLVVAFNVRCMLYCKDGFQNQSTIIIFFCFLDHTSYHLEYAPYFLKGRLRIVSQR